MVKPEAVLEAIRKAAGELGRAPSRAELKRLTGVSHFMVLKQFATLREAVQAAGFTPHVKGRRASTADLLEDFNRVARKLGKQPSRAEYLREGKYSAGTYKQRFGSWVQAVEEWEKSNEESASGTQPPALGIQPRDGSPRETEEPELETAEKGTQQPTLSGQPGETSERFQEKIKEPEANPHRQDILYPTREAIEKEQAAWRELRRRVRMGEVDLEPQILWPDDHRTEEWVPRSAPALPAELRGKRRVTEGVAAMLVGGLLQGKKWKLIIGEETTPQQIYTDGRAWEEERGAIVPSAQDFSGLALRSDTSMASTSPQLNLVQARAETFFAGSPPENPAVLPESWQKHQIAAALRRLNLESIGGRLRKGRPVTGPPLERLVMTNAPHNEMGVVALFCMLAADLGYQLESLQSGFPDCEARRQVGPGKWQRVRIEFEYESRNFVFHHHDPLGCDMIVCWRHNWAKCPEHLEVLELRRIIGRWPELP
ncbi:MAG: homing endonuclease associated repeat-containing protein [Candidatus Angelobacter sp.]